MPDAILTYVRWVDRINRRIGRATMWGIFLMIGVLFWSVISKNTPGLLPSLWTVELAQFLMVAYFMLGGPYSMQMDEHVRMDLVYGAWSPRTRAAVDTVTVVLLIVYLGFLLYGGYRSLSYSIEYGERSYSAWRPYMWPIKSVMLAAIVLMLFQAVAQLFRDIAEVKGEPIPRLPEALPGEFPDETPGSVPGQGEPR